MRASRTSASAPCARAGPMHLVSSDPKRFVVHAARRSLASLVALGLALAPAAAVAVPQDKAAAPAAAGDTPRIAMRNVMLFPYDDVSTRIAALAGTADSTRPSQPITMDDVASYDVQVAYAEMHMDARSLTNLMNRYILPAANSPIRHVDITFDQGAVRMTGTMVKAGVPVPFSATATLGPTAQGDMRMHITSMRAAGVVPKGLMDALGLDLATVAPPENNRIFHVDGDDMILPVVSMFPPPKFIGRLSAVRVTPQEMVSTMGQPVPVQKPGIAAEGYVYFRGGSVTFAKLTMHDTDLAMVPKDHTPVLRFSPTHYYQQLQAGYSVSLPNEALVGYVANYPAAANAAR